MESETTNLSTTSSNSPIYMDSYNIQKYCPDYPQKTDDISKEDYHVAVKDYFKLKGLKHDDDFSDDEKKIIVEECSVKLIGPRVLSQKYNTMHYIINHFVKEAGFYRSFPDDLTNFPDFPKRSDEMTQEEYQGILQTYWKKRQNKRTSEKRYQKRKAAKETNVNDILENWIPDDLTEHPDFPEYLDGFTHEVYAKKIENYWANRKRKDLKRKMPGFQPRAEDW